MSEPSVTTANELAELLMDPDVWTPSDRPTSAICPACGADIPHGDDNANRELHIFFHANLFDALATLQKWSLRTF